MKNGIIMVPALRTTEYCVTDFSFLWGKRGSQRIGNGLFLFLGRRHPGAQHPRQTQRKTGRHWQG
jgi:hypothetical protein